MLKAWRVRISCLGQFNFYVRRRVRRISVCASPSVPREHTRSGQKKMRKRGIVMMQWIRFAVVGMLLGVCAMGAGAQSADQKATNLTNTIAPLLADCVGSSTAGTSPAPADDQKNHGFDLANLDRSVSPCDNFYLFANGGWMKNNPIPAAYPRWGSFTILQQHNQDVLRTILEEAAKDKAPKPGSNWQKIGDFYSSCIDESQIEAAGVKPLGPEFERIAQIKDAATLQAEVARLQNEGADAVFNFGSQ